MLVRGFHLTCSEDFGLNKVPVWAQHQVNLAPVHRWGFLLRRREIPDGKFIFLVCSQFQPGPGSEK